MRISELVEYYYYVLLLLHLESNLCFLMKEWYFSLSEENIKSWERITLLVRTAVLFEILQTELYLHIEYSCR